MILEAIVTTQDAAGRVNIAPMGPQVDEAISTITLKPFRSSRTFQNLRDTGRAVLHVVDDVELIAAAAIGDVDPAGIVERLLDGWVKLIDCCRWFAVEVFDWSDSPQTGVQPRPFAQCRVVHHGTQREMFGLNRGKHAVVEAAILATRIQLLGRDEVLRQMLLLQPLVDKTGGPAEHRAWTRLQRFVER